MSLQESFDLGTPAGRLIQGEGGEGGSRAGETVQLGDCIACIQNQEAREQTGPSLARKAMNLGWSDFTHVASGMPMFDKVTYEDRLAICQECESYQPNGVCRECGCILAIKAKMRMETCPLAKW